MARGFITWNFVFTVFIATFGGSFQLFNLATINQSQLIIQNWISETLSARYNSTITDSTVTLIYSMTSSAIAFGAIFGSFLTRILADKLGRRNALVVNGVIGVVGAIFAGIAKSISSPESLVVGRIILGINTGAASGLVPMYLTECAPVQYRGAVGSVHQMVVAFADFASLVIGLPEVLGGEQLWPLAVALTGFPALLLVICLPFCHESPRYLLITRGRYDLAQDAILFYSGPTHLKDLMKHLSREAAFSQLYTGGKIIGIWSLLKMREVRTPLFISSLVMFGQQFTACATVFSYSTDMFISAGLVPAVARLATVGVGLGYFLFTVPAIYLIEKLGRRKLSLCQLVGCMIGLIAMSLLTGFANAVPENRALSYGTIAALASYMCIYGLGSPIPWIMASELFDQKNRSTAVTVNTAISWSLAFIISLCYLPLEQAVGPGLSYLPFIVALGVVIVLMFLFLPETKNKSIDQIVGEFRQRRNTVSRTVHLGGDTDSAVGSGHSGNVKRQNYGTMRKSRVSVMSEISEDDIEEHPLLKD